MPTCFVLMPFAPEFQDIWDQVIRPAGAAVGYSCTRADDPSRPGAVMKDVVEGLLFADVIVADLSKLNANVLYELGVAHSIGTKTVMICDRSVKRLPFDLSGYRTLLYGRTKEGLRELRKQLEVVLTDISALNERPANPVWQFAPASFSVVKGTKTSERALKEIFGVPGRVAFRPSIDRREGRGFVRDSDIAVLSSLRKYVDESDDNYDEMVRLEDPSCHVVVTGSPRYNKLAELIQMYFDLPYQYVFTRSAATPDDRVLRIITEYGDELSASRDNWIDWGDRGVDYGVLFVASLAHGKRLIWLSGIHGKGTLGVYRCLVENADRVLAELQGLRNEHGIGVSWLVRVRYDRRSSDSSSDGIEAEILGSSSKVLHKKLGGNPRALVADLGGVIMDFDRTRTYRAIGHVVGMTFGEVQQRIEGTDIRERYERGLLTDEQFCDELASLFPQAGPRLKDLIPEYWGDIFWASYDVLGALRCLRDHGVVLALLSNTNAMHFNHVKKDYPELVSLFSRLVLSYEAQKTKPDSGLYEDVLSWLMREHRIPVNSTLYVDDTQEYVEQAKRHGITGHVYRSYPHFVFWLRKQGLYVP